MGVRRQRANSPGGAAEVPRRAPATPVTISPPHPSALQSLPMNDRSHLLTELRLPESMRLDAMPIADAVALMNQQDAKAVEAVGQLQSEITRAIEHVVAA